MIRRKFDDEEHLIAEGRRAFAAAQYGEAITAWTRVVTLHPDSPIRWPLAEAHFRHALDLYRNRGALNSIISDLSLATRHAPDRAMYWYHLGLAYGKAGIPAKALAGIRKAVALDPTSERYLYHQALFALDANPGEALKILMNHIGAGDHWKYLEILFNLRQQQPDLAYHSAQDISDERGEVTFLKGIAAMMQGRHDIARQLLSIALGKNPKSPAIAYYLGCSYSAQNDLAPATKLWEAAYAGGLRVPEIESALAAAYYNQALDHALARRFDELIASFQNIQRLSTERGAEVRPLLALGFFLKANQTLESGGVSAAIPLWQQALNHYEDLLRSVSGNKDQESVRRHYIDQTHKLYHNLALGYELTEKIDLAMLNWERLVKAWRSRYRNEDENIDPTLIVGAYRHLADSYQKIGRLGEAMEAYNLALRFKPDQWDIYEELGELCMANEQWDQAAEHWNEVLRIKGPESDALTKLGVARARAGQPEEALRCWTRALELEPKNPAAKREIFRSREPEIVRLLERGRYDRALEILEDLLTIIPDLPTVRIMMSDAYWGRSQRGHAMDQIERALDINPRDPNIWIEIIQSLLFNKRAKELIAIVDSAETQFADDPVFYLNLGHAYLDFDRDRKAVQYYDKALEIIRRTRAQDPALPEALANTALEIAWKWVDLREFVKARRYFKVALDVHPEKALYHYFLGCALAEDHMMADAEKAWGQAEALAPGDEKLLHKIRAARVSFSAKPDVPKDLEDLMRMMRLLK